MAFSSFLGAGETLTRRREAGTQNGDGTLAYAPSDITFRGLIQQQSSRDVFVGDRQSAVSNHRLYFVPPLDLLSTDQIVDGEGNIYDATDQNDVHKLGRVGQCDLVLRREKAVS